MDKHMNTKRILIFLGFAFGLPWGAALVLALTLGVDDAIQAATLANLIFISSPALANLATRLITKEGWKHLWLGPNFQRSWRIYLAAWLLPLFAALIGGAIFYLLSPQSFDPSLGALQTLVAGTPSLAATNPWMVLLFIGLQVMLVGLTINGLASIGEEFGWRAYLLPKLIERFSGAEPGSGVAQVTPSASLFAAGARKASLLIGLIWGVWHWPLFFMTAKLDPNFTPLFPLVYLVFTCSLSVLLSWVTLRSNSVWPAAIGHGTINGTSGLAGYLLKGTANPLLGPGPSGLIGVTGYLALALVLLLQRNAFVMREEDGPEKARVEVIASHS